MATGLSTGAIYKPFFRNPLQAGTESNLFTADYDSSTTAGPTKENLAIQQNKADISKLASEIAAKETPAATKAREDSSYFSEAAQERELQSKKDALQKKIDDNALEIAVKNDPFFLIKDQWDRYVIKAANGETVTVEVENTTGAVNADGSFPVTVIEIKKSSRLQKLSSSHANSDATAASIAQIDKEYVDKRSALQQKYQAETDPVTFSQSGGIVSGSDVAIKAYNAELSSLISSRDKAKAIASVSPSMAPPSQGLNVEPHTIAIYAPGYCMNSGCCLEKAFYTLRSTAKAIESSADSEANIELKDLLDQRKKLVEQIEGLKKVSDSQYSAAATQVSQLSVAEYQNAYQKSVTYLKGPTGNVTMVQGTKPDPADYTAEKYLDKYPELLVDYHATEEEITDRLAELEMFDTDFAEKKEKVVARLTQDAKNYRLLLSHCTFQPSCPEWLEDVGSATLDALSSSAEAIGSAYSWAYDTVADGLSTIGGVINDGLAYIGDLQDQLAELTNFQGLCSLNPFGGTLGCKNCPMSASCSSQQNSLSSKISNALATNTFLVNLKRALGLGNGQILNNLLRCLGAVSNQTLSAIHSVMDFSVGSGMASVLGRSGDILGQQNYPNFNTKIADCVGNISSIDEAESAITLLERTSSGPMSIMQSKVPGMDISGFDFSKIDNVNTSSRYFSSGVLGSNKLSLLNTAKSILGVELPSGSTRYYDGKNVDTDNASRRLAEMQAAGVSFA